MSRGDDDDPKQPSDRHIAIPGYRAPTASGARHRPPSVGRRRTGALPDVAPTRKVSSPPRAVSSPPRPVSSPPRGRHAPSSPPPAAVSEPPSEAEPAKVVEPRGVEALQAEVARDDVRMLAHQIATAEPRETRPAPAAPYTPGAWIRWRPHLTAALVVAGLLAVALPVIGTYRYRSDAARLPDAMAAAARVVGEASAPGEVASWIRERDLDSLRTFYGKQRPVVVERLSAAGYDVATEDVTIRVDYGAETLIIGAQVDLGRDERVFVSADLAARPLGRAMPAPTIGSSVGEHSGLVVGVLVGLALLLGLMWGGPALRARAGR